MLRITLFLFTFLSISTSAQHVELHWYNLISLQPLSTEDGKVAVTRIAELVDDSMLTYNAKSSMFMLATKSSVDFNALIDSLNISGYFIANVTGGIHHQEVVVKSGFNFQAALLYFRNYAQYLELGLDDITLNTSEIALLKQEYSFDPDQIAVFKYQQE